MSAFALGSSMNHPRPLFMSDFLSRSLWLLSKKKKNQQTALGCLKANLLITKIRYFMFPRRGLGIMYVSFKAANPSCRQPVICLVALPRENRYEAL